MKLSESLRKNIMDVTVGRIVNTFKARPRRYVLFFEDILASYIKECEMAGHGKETREIAKNLMGMVVFSITPPLLRKLPLILLLKTAKRMWTNIGALDDLKVIKKDNTLTIETKKEFLSRIIGENEFCPGLFEGGLSSLSDSQIQCIQKTQTEDTCKYVFMLNKGSYKPPECKPKNVYNTLNNFPKSRGFEFKEAIRKGIFIIKPNNRISFREKILIPVENTLFHLISNSQLLTDKIPHISYNFFKDIIDENASKEAKLILLKNVLQVTGWGIVNTEIKRNRILMSIKNIPYGLQIERDNWDFITRIILGYLWNIDDYSIENTGLSNRILKIHYTKN